jgi:MFS family permease
MALMLLQLVSSFNLCPIEQGLLGGVAFLSHSLGNPIALYVFKHYQQQRIIGYSLFASTTLTLWLALIPVNIFHSVPLLILIRGLIGLTSSIYSAYIPVWINDHVPHTIKAKWITQYQLSGPVGVIAGYVLSTIVLSLASPADLLHCGGIFCWRWPVLIEVLLLVPTSLMFVLLPSEVANVRLRKTGGNSPVNQGSKHNARATLSIASKITKTRESSLLLHYREHSYIDDLLTAATPPPHSPASVSPSPAMRKLASKGCGVMGESGSEGMCSLAMT